MFNEVEGKTIGLKDCSVREESQKTRLEFFLDTFLGRNGKKNKFHHILGGSVWCSMYNVI